jgi:hypothetical protein
LAIPKISRHKSGIGTSIARLSSTASMIGFTTGTAVHGA